MDNILNITNGGSAAAIIRRAGIPGAVLPWQDVLHDGPVPAGLTLEELSKVRARFIAMQGWGSLETIEQEFIKRDTVLRTCDQFDKVILWFEHDLYDQLQLLQILGWFEKNRPIKPVLAMICVDQYLGMMSPEQMAALFRYEQAVSDEQLALASTAWRAYRSDTPEQWQALLQSDTHALPFLAGAVLRQLQEYPDCDDGLSRTARQALIIIARGEQRPGRIFAQYQATEERVFMGDASFWVLLNELLDSTPPLLSLTDAGPLPLPAGPDQLLAMTSAGEEVLAGTRNWLDSLELDRWIGGVHLTPDNLWCWNRAAAKLTKSPPAGL